MKFLRSALAILAGVIVGGALIGTIETIGHVVYPPPPGVDLSKPEDMQTLIEQLPPGAFCFVLLAWAVGALAGATLAAWIAGRSPVMHGMIVAMLFLVGGVLTMIMIPHPVWMWVLGIVIPIGFGYLGGCLGKRLATRGSSPTGL